MRNIGTIALFALLITGCGGSSHATDDAGSTGSIVTPYDGEAFTIEVDTPPTIMQGTTVTLPLTLVRTGPTRSDINITITGAPAGIAASVLMIPASEDTGNLEITVAGTVAQGPVNLYIQGHAVNDWPVATTTTVPFFVRGRPGSLDTTFGAGQTILTGQPAKAFNAFVSADDNVLVFGQCNNPNVATCVVRLTPDGAIDTTYGVDGVAVLANLDATTAVLLPDGSTAVGGATVDEAQTAYGIISTDGKNVGSAITLTKTFNTNDVQPAGYVNSMTLTPDGGLAMSFGAGNNIIGIAKLTNAGYPDAGFGTGGFTSVAGTQAINTWSPSTSGTAVWPNGKILILSNSSILQLDTKGALDTSFGSGGQVITYGSGGQGAATPVGMLLMPDGRIIVPIGSSNSYSIGAFVANGGIDKTFGSYGYITSVSSYGVPPNLFLDDQNRLLVTTGITGPLQSVRRYLNTGAPDSSFGMSGNGWATFTLPADFPPTTEQVATIAARVQKDGRIIVLSESLADGSNDVVVSRLWN
ncbi:MAG: hypothetical protein FWD69_02960 [Polyangiaceae bacterium]|nr:hypothetical protein [Polyangiaceae bacterium]